MEVNQRFGIQFASSVKLGMIIPHLQCEISSGVGNGPFEIWFASLGFPFLDRLQLRTKGRFERFFARGGKKFANRHGSAKPNHVLHRLNPKEKKASRRITEAPVGSELDQATFFIVLDLLRHFFLDLLNNMVGVGNKKIVGS